MEMGLRIKALERAAKAHEGQPYGDLPYVVHVTEVAMLVAALGGTDEDVAAAFLHDSVEDTDITLDDLAAEFGHKVAGMVAGLTHKDGMSYEDYMAVMPLHSRPIKFADSMRNLIRTMALPEDHPKREKWTIKYARNVAALLPIVIEGEKWMRGFGRLYVYDAEFHAAVDLAQQVASS